MTRYRKDKKFNFECQRCGKCCSLYCIPCTDKDIHRILNLLNLPPEKASDFIELVEPEDIVLTSYEDVPKILVDDIDSENLVLVLKSDDYDNYCCFYEEGKCKIYPARPFVCRFYPFVYEYEGDSEIELINKPKDITYSVYENGKYCKGVGKGNKVNFDNLRKSTVQTIKEDYEFEKKVKIWNIMVIFNQIRKCNEKDFFKYILEVNE